MAAETKAQKAVAKADELRKKLDDTKKAIEKKLPSVLDWGGAIQQKDQRCSRKINPHLHHCDRLLCRIPPAQGLQHQEAGEHPLPLQVPLPGTPDRGVE